MAYFAVVLLLVSCTEGEPNLRHPFYIKGTRLEEQGDYKKAAAAFVKCVRMAPDNRAAHIRLGVLYEEHLGNPAVAMHHYERAVSDVANDPFSELASRSLERVSQALGMPLPEDQPTESIAGEDEGMARATRLHRDDEREGKLWTPEPSASGAERLIKAAMADTDWSVTDVVDSWELPSNETPDREEALEKTVDSHGNMAVSPSEMPEPEPAGGQNKIAAGSPDSGSGPGQQELKVARIELELRDLEERRTKLLSQLESVSSQMAERKLELRKLRKP